MVTAGAFPRLGVIADSSRQRHLLSATLEASGYLIALTIAPDRVDGRVVRDAAMDLWLVDLEDEERWLDSLADLFDSLDATVLYGDGRAPQPGSHDYPRWERKILGKVQKLVGDPVAVAPLPFIDAGDSISAISSLTEPDRINMVLETESPGVVSAENPLVWVLGASFGGPAAVKAFLDDFPHHLPVAFVLAQHIDTGFQKTLGQVLGRHNQFVYVRAEQGHRLRAGEVLIVPTERAVFMDSAGIVQMREHAWQAPYAPSIDQVMEDTLAAVGARNGAILFSGMGNDGAMAARRLHQQGVPVWAQVADSCACSSQPDAARQTGCVSFNGTPAELAAHLVGYVGEKLAEAERLADQTDNENDGVTRV